MTCLIWEPSPRFAPPHEFHSRRLLCTLLEFDPERNGIDLD
jgi:hypothetical protein